MSESLWERRRRTFESTAEAYDRFRPSYPDELFDDIKKYADLAPDDRILEIGAGTGRATEKFALWGNPLLAIEPSAPMADIIRAKLARYENVDVQTSRFEEADLEPNAFGLVTCAQAFHWLDRATRHASVARCLYAHGTVAIIGNVQVTPEDNRPFFVRVQGVYNAIAPDLAHKGEFRKPDELPEHSLAASELFYDHREFLHPWQWTLDTEQYIGLMSTTSAHAALDADTRMRLLDGIAELIDAEFGGEVTEHYVAIASLSRRS